MPSYLQSNTIFVPKCTIPESSLDIIPEVQSEGGDKRLSDRINPKNVRKEKRRSSKDTAAASDFLQILNSLVQFLG